MQRFLSLAVVLAVCAPSFGQNLLTNPGFEEGMTGWTLFGGGSVQTGNYFNMTAVEGTSFWAIVRSGGGTSCNGCEDLRDGVYQTVTLEPGTYVLRGYVQAYNNSGGFAYTPGAPSTNPGETWAQLAVDLTGGTDPLAASVTPTTPRIGTAAQFEQQEMTFTVTASGPVTVFLISMSKWHFAGNWQGFDNIELAMDNCNNPSTIAAVDPPSVGNEPNPGITQLTISGTNLEAVTAAVLRGSSTIVGSIVNQQSTQLVVDFDLTNAGIGSYSLTLERNSPCPDAYVPNAFRVTYAPTLFRNGGFELGDPTDANDMPGWTYVQFRPWPGWGSPPPTLAKKTAVVLGGVPCEGTFFGGGDAGGHANFHVGLVQNFTTVPGATYRVTGCYFGGLQNSNDTGWWEVLIKDGITENPDITPGSTLIAKKERLPNGGDINFNENFDGAFVAASDSSTILLKWGRSESADWKYSMAGWDNIAIVATCHTPFADADNDGDVDQEDFGVFQRCYTGTGLGPVPSGAGFEYCTCFDRNNAGDVDQADWSKFEACATGPEIKFIDVQGNLPNCVP